MHVPATRENRVGGWNVFMCHLWTFSCLVLHLPVINIPTLVWNHLMCSAASITQVQYWKIKSLVPWYWTPTLLFFKSNLIFLHLFSRQLISFYTMSQNPNMTHLKSSNLFPLPPLWVRCDRSDPKQTAWLGAEPLSTRNQLTGINLHTVTSKGKLFLLIVALASQAPPQIWLRDDGMQTCWYNTVFSFNC